MTIQQLKYVVEIARCGAVNEAAKKLFVSQPSLSSALKDIESELSIKIFKRTGSGVELLPEGIEFLSYANQIIDQMKLLEKRYFSSDLPLKRFSVSTQHYAFVVKAFAEYIKTNEDSSYEYYLRETKTFEIISDVKNYRSEIGIIYVNDFNSKIMHKTFRDNKLRFVELFTAKPHIFISSNNPLAKKKIVKIKELKDYPYLCFEQGSNDSFFFSEEILSTLLRSKSIKVSDRATLFNLLIGINGYTISTGIICSELNGPDIIAVPLDSDENITVGLISRSDASYSKCAKEFIDCLKIIVQKEKSL